jgi:hypothetical protein
MEAPIGGSLAMATLPYPYLEDALVRVDVVNITLIFI